MFTGRADAVGELGTFFVVVFIFGFGFVFVINVKIIYKSLVEEPLCLAPTLMVWGPLWEFRLRRHNSQAASGALSPASTSWSLGELLGSSQLARLLLWELG